MKQTLDLTMTFRVPAGEYSRKPHFDGVGAASSSISYEAPEPSKLYPCTLSAIMQRALSTMEATTLGSFGGQRNKVPKEWRIADKIFSVCIGLGVNQSVNWFDHARFIQFGRSVVSPKFVAALIGKELTNQMFPLTDGVYEAHIATLTPSLINDMFPLTKRNEAVVGGY